MSAAAPLAVLGGEPAFPAGLPFVRPPAPPLDDVVRRLAPSYDRGLLTNGPLVRELEDVVAARLGVAHAVAVASCTSGLMLTLRVLELQGPVLLPSFTFSASAHAVAWCGHDRVFAECDEYRFQLDVGDAKERAAGVAAILATHVFGAPCRPREVEALGAAAGVPVVFDAAHALGARHGERAVGGFGAAEVFSLTPTKPVVAGEGGLVTTADAALAEAVRIGRDYGNPGDYDTRFVGLNARMSEFHAAVALESLRHHDGHLARRRDLAAEYRAALAGIAGLRVQAVDPGDESTWKDFTIAVDETFGLPRDEAVAVLAAEGVDTRCYFDPPVHRQRSHARGDVLPATDRAASRVVSLPLYPALPAGAPATVAGILRRAQADAARVRAALAATRSR